MLWQVFCLVLAGDAQSTRRLSEIFMAGCIPVFVGPPYNSMPLAEDVHYKSIGVFFNISNYKSWLPEVRPADGAIKAAEAMLWDLRSVTALRPRADCRYMQKRHGVTPIGAGLVESGKVYAFQQQNLKPDLFLIMHPACPAWAHLDSLLICQSCPTTGIELELELKTEWRCEQG